MTLTIKLDRNWSSFQLANSAPPLSVTDSAIAPSARMLDNAMFYSLVVNRVSTHAHASLNTFTAGTSMILQIGHSTW